jgi:hypothetical protein
LLDLLVWIQSSIRSALGDQIDAFAASSDVIALAGMLPLAIAFGMALTLTHIGSAVILAMDARIGTRPLAGWSVTPTICGRRRVRNPDEAPGRIRSASRLRHEVELPVQAEREQSARARSGKVA